jgi:export-related chaperone CsaA
VKKIIFEDFSKVRIIIGTILEAELNPKANKPAYILKIDFGNYGIKTSSAQITKNYSKDNLIGMQISAVVNFPIKKIAGIKSEVLVLGVISEQKDIILLTPTETVEEGSLVC